MVRLTRITTKTGDQGMTSLGDGRRVGKDNLRMEAIGTIDEASAAIGLARLHAKGRLDAMLVRLQHDLFDLGADLSVPAGGKPGRSRLRISDGQVARLERETAAMLARQKPLASFVLPGGTALAAHLHVARAVVRRAERLMVALAKKETVGAPALVYVNRLSDHLFVMSRAANKGRDVLWQPGANRHE